MVVAFDNCVAFCAFWNRKLQLELKQNHHIVQSQEILDHGAPKSLPKYNLICHLCWKQQSEGVAKIVLQILERRWTFANTFLFLTFSSHLHLHLFFVSFTSSSFTVFFFDGVGSLVTVVFFVWLLILFSLPLLLSFNGNLHLINVLWGNFQWIITWMVDNTEECCIRNALSMLTHSAFFFFSFPSFYCFSSSASFSSQLPSSSSSSFSATFFFFGLSSYDFDFSFFTSHYLLALVSITS